MESKNLIISEAVFDDCKYFAEWENRPEVSEFFTMDGEYVYEDAVTDFVRYNLDPTKMLFTIKLKPEDKPIGKIFLSRIDTKEDALDITRIYIADPALRGKGYGEQAIRLILEYAFINLHMERVTIDHFEKNKTAATLYEKIGFKDEGLMRNAGKKNGKYVNLQLKSMLRAEYYDKLHSK